MVVSLHHIDQRDVVKVKELECGGCYLCIASDSLLFSSIEQLHNHSFCALSSLDGVKCLT